MSIDESDVKNSRALSNNIYIYVKINVTLYSTDTLQQSDGAHRSPRGCWWWMAHHMLMLLNSHHSGAVVSFEHIIYKYLHMHTILDIDRFHNTCRPTLDQH